MENNNNNPDAKSLKSTEEVVLHIKNLWLCHKAGIKQPHGMAYMVELPPPSEEELKENRRPKEYGQEELSGGFV